LQPEHSLKEWLARLESGHPADIELGLERSRAVLGRLDISFSCPVITVGGTNGKGSTCAFLEAILKQSGYRTGLYTSPHLLSYNERVRIDGANCTDDAIVSGLEAVEAVRGSTSLTYFEHGTLGALWQFSGAGLDALILEVGLGGRLDAVNLIDSDVSIVTSVDLDHQDWLGHDRESIGFEKAGIFRPGRPAVCTDPHPPQSLVKHAETTSADLQLLGRDFSYQDAGEAWDLNWRGRTVALLPRPALSGAFQLRNASAALAGLLNLGDSLPVSAGAMREGIAMAHVAGRFQKVAERPQVILDVAHNPEAARALASNLRDSAVSGRTYAVFAMLADKDLAGVIAPLKDRIDAWFICGLDVSRGRSQSQIAEQSASLLGNRLQGSYPSPVEAYEAAAGCATENDRIIIFGSFHTVASVAAAHSTWRLTR
jgi:dihydrofolate synthase/folylpolyglutamate synthase